MVSRPCYFVAFGTPYSSALPVSRSTAHLCPHRFVDGGPIRAFFRCEHHYDVVDLSIDRPIVRGAILGRPFLPEIEGVLVD